MQKVFITGSSGFIGFHLAQLLLREGFTVAGYDGMTEYYDVRIKYRRLELLRDYAGFSFTKGMLEEFELLREAIIREKPNVIVHLAAQAGVRYSIENPRAYLQSNLVGTFNVMECAREFKVDHFLMASTSSVYGANDTMPFNEREQVNTPLSFYAATKKANEAMGHSYAHIYNLPITMFRFFTVYGPWGRPDMALFKFTKGILEGTPIDVFNHGNMHRDFTYIADLVKGIRLLMDAVPRRPECSENIPDWDSLSPVAPYRVVNIGNNKAVKLLDFVDAIEQACGITATRNYVEMQRGDVPATWADATLLKHLTGYNPSTDIADGVSQFVRWYREYYNL